MGCLNRTRSPQGDSDRLSWMVRNQHPSAAHTSASIGDGSATYLARIGLDCGERTWCRVGNLQAKTEATRFPRLVLFGKTGPVRIETDCVRARADDNPRQPSGCANLSAGEPCPQS